MAMMRNSSHDLIIPTTSSPTWKLYRNPFFNDNSHHLQQRTATHFLHPSRNAFSDMEENRVDVLARAQIKELKAELDYERRSRKKVEILNKKLARELAEERRGRATLVKVCENLARKITVDKAEIDRTKIEIEEERKMLRMAEVLREERVQMKLSDARIIWDEKMSELRLASGDTESASAAIERNWELGLVQKADESEEIGIGGQCYKKVMVGGDKWWDEVSGSRERVVTTSDISGGGGIGSIENPHIRRGIKGFVEFPRTVNRNNVGMKSSSKHWGTKLECQRAQMRIQLKQRSPIRSNTVIIS
ncbi:Protein BRANCHLESS TRICHOME [Linum perenne]